MKNKRKKRNNIETSYGMKPPEHARQIEKLTIAEFVPNTADAKMQIHMLIDPKGLKETLVMRFHSPDTLGDLIEQLNFYRNRAWPEAEDLDLNKDFENQEEETNAST